MVGCRPLSPLNGFCIDSAKPLRSLSGQHCNVLTMSARPQSQRDRCQKSKHDADVTLSDVANDWPLWISHVDKARIVRDFHTTTSSDTLRSIVCVSCAESVHASGVSNLLVSVIDLDILCSPQPTSSGQTGPVPPPPPTLGSWLISRCPL